MNGVIERVRAMAREAIEQYGRETHAGGEPVYPDWADDVLAVCHAAERAPAVPPANPNGEGCGVIKDVKQARKAAKQALQEGLRGWFPAACVVLARALDEAERRTAPQADDAQKADDARDAERYRKLRAMATQQADCLGPVFRIDVRRSGFTLHNFDAAVDAAMRKEGE